MINPVLLENIKNGSVVLPKGDSIRYIVYSFNVSSNDNYPLRWNKKTHMFDICEMSITYRQLIKEMDDILVKDKNAMIIAFDPYNYFIVRDRIETDCARFNGVNTKYSMKENENPDFDYTIALLNS